MDRARRAALIALLSAVTVTVAHANGAFPDSLAIHLPTSAPGTLYLSTNFGLLVTTDGGASWRWICEGVTGTNAWFYSLGPENRMYATSQDGLRSSNDGACTWTSATGALAGTRPFDVFPDPIRAARVLVLTWESSGTAVSLYESNDSGLSFNGPPLYTATAPAFLTGVETARTEPQTIYLTQYNNAPFIVRSSDGGARWQTFSLEASLGKLSPALLAVDPENAFRLYLRLRDYQTSKESLGISDDGGATARVALQLPGQMSAFLRRSDGALIVGRGEGGALISTDGGASFTEWGTTLRLRALAERANQLYAATDNTLDGFALAESEDQGTTWKPLLRYQDICGPSECGSISSTCAGAWQALKTTLGIPPGACSSPAAPDAGSGSVPTRRCGCGVADPLWVIWALLPLERLLQHRSRR
jgi:hypothetical protein